MAKEEKKAPKLRFNGYTNDWEQVKLEEVVEITMGQSPSSKNYTNNSSDHILVQGNADMKNGHVEPRVWTTQITKQAKKGDLILSVRAPVGDIGKTDYDVVIGRGVAAIKGNEYIFQVLIKMKDSGYWTRFSTGSTFESINSSNIRNAQIMIPKDDEQTKIAKVLTFLDNTIQLHERKCEELALIKKALLQKLFPKKDEINPEVRYKNFNDAWEQRKLGEVAHIETGKLDANAMVENGKYDFYTSGIKKYRIDIPAFKGPAITIAGNGATVGYMHLADGEFNAYQRTYVLTKFLANRHFIFSEIGNKLPRKIQQESRAGNIPYIVMDMLTDLQLFLPSIAEQEKVGELLNKLNSLITLHQRKLEKLKQLKKFLLQNMFI